MYKFTLLEGKTKKVHFFLIFYIVLLFELHVGKYFMYAAQSESMLFYDHGDMFRFLIQVLYI